MTKLRWYGWGDAAKTYPLDHQEPVLSLPKDDLGQGAKS